MEMGLLLVKSQPDEPDNRDLSGSCGVRSLLVQAGQKARADGATRRNFELLDGWMDILDRAMHLA